MSKTITTGVELKPCPFCGGGDLELVDYTDNVYGFWDYKIRCGTCRAYMDSPSTAKIPLTMVTSVKREMKKPKQRPSES